MATLIRVDGSIDSVSDMSLSNLQKLVDGYIEYLYTRSGMALVVDSEGRLKNKTVNSSATELYGYPVVGDVVLAFQGELE